MVTSQPSATATSLESATHAHAAALRKAEGRYFQPSQSSTTILSRLAAFPRDVERGLVGAARGGEFASTKSAPLARSRSRCVAYAKRGLKDAKWSDSDIQSDSPGCSQHTNPRSLTYKGTKKNNKGKKKKPSKKTKRTKRKRVQRTCSPHSSQSD